MKRALFLAVLLAFTGHAHARTLDADIAKITLPIATLEGVHVQLDWPANAPRANCGLQTTRLQSPSLGIDARKLTWTCPLRRIDAHGWGCEGELRAGKEVSDSASRSTKPACPAR
jgi:hypothetical protein